MGGIVELITHTADRDWLWWPFVSLRPARDADITTRRALEMTALYDPVSGLILSAPALVVSSWARHHPAPLIATCVALVSAVSFVFYQWVFAPCWNARAAALRGEVARFSRATTYAALSAVFASMVGVMVAAGALGAVAGSRRARAARPRIDYVAAEVRGRAEASRWFPGRTQSECFEEGMRRDAACRTRSCQVEVMGFVEVCFDRAASTAGFCDGVPFSMDTDEDLRWRQARCRETHPDALRQCVSFIPVLQLHCYLRRPTRVRGTNTVALAR